MDKCLEDDSQKCYKFIKENSLIKDKISSKYLDTIFNKLKNIDKGINQICEKKNIKEVNIGTMEISDYVSPNHLQEIKSEKWQMIERNCSLNNFNWNVYQYNSEKNNKFNELSIKRIAYILALHKYNENVKLNIYLYPTLFKKHITEDKEWTPEHINSGLSSSTTTIRDVYIWRYEEMPKVVLHEMVHAMELDEALFNKELSNRFVSEYGLLSSKYINVFETYTEIVAGILNIMIFCMEYNKNNFYELLNIERNWSLFQAASVLKASGYNSFNEFENDKSKFIQHTNVFAYYILRSAHMYSLNKFIDWIEKNSSNNFRLNSSAKDTYYEISMDALSNKKYQNIIDEYMKLFDTLRENNFVKKSMRMTAIEGLSKIFDSIYLGGKKYYIKKII